jgi:transcriptional regulator with XRE-family HTH domain
MGQTVQTAEIIVFRAMNDLPNRVRELRKAAHLTLQQLGAMVGTSHSHISDIELGNRQLTQKWMEVLSRALSCDPADLLRFSESVRSLSPDEQTLIDHYRHAPEEGRQAINRVAETLSSYTPPPLEFSITTRSG